MSKKCESLQVCPLSINYESSNSLLIADIYPNQQRHWTYHIMTKFTHWHWSEKYQKNLTCSYLTLWPFIDKNNILLACYLYITMIILIIGSTSDSGHSSSSPRYCIKNYRVRDSLASFKTALIGNGDLIFIIGENQTEIFTGQWNDLFFVFFLNICNNVNNWWALKEKHWVYFLLV